MKLTKTYRIEQDTSDKLNDVAKREGVFQSYIVEKSVKNFIQKYDNPIQQPKSAINKIGSIFK